MADWHLAQINVATLLAPIDSPQLEDFVAELDDLNELAERSPGFVWRFKDDSGNSTAVRIEGEDDGTIINFTVWESVEQLFEYAYKSAHNDIMVRRREWFARHFRTHLVCWWVSAGHIPSLEEAGERLTELRADGPSERAFTMKERFRMPASV